MAEAAKTRVIAAVLERNGRYLVGRRPIQKRHGGLWEFPGGKFEPGETVLDAATRELAEELGVEVVRVHELLFAIDDPGSHFVIEFHPTEFLGEPDSLEHSSLHWASLEELQAMELAP
ncbi:MAG: NUDIX domain-containing protein, partial [Gemmatimonadales bacterium]